VRLVAALLEGCAGATVNAQSSSGDTALTVASSRGLVGAVRSLLARGARQELQNELGQSALHNAARKGHAGVAELLCAAPGAAAALVLRTKNGATPLVLAAEHGGGGEGLVTALLAADPAGVTVDAQDDQGSTALIFASFKGEEGAVRLLLARGARQELQIESGEAALHIAAQESRTGVVELLCAAPGAAAALALRNKDGNTPLMLALMFCGRGGRLVAALLAAGAAGASTDAQSNKGCTALSWASEKGHEGAVRLLLACGARQELQDDQGGTALHHAVTRGHAGIVKLLCAAPGAAAALSLRTKGGNTPLDIAENWHRAGCAAILRAHGATS